MRAWSSFVIVWLVDLGVTGSIPEGGINLIKLLASPPLAQSVPVSLSHVGRVCSRARPAQTVAGREASAEVPMKAPFPGSENVLG